jgi:hypothetical protein
MNKKQKIERKKLTREEVRMNFQKKKMENKKIQN